jgi:hypothetical protein
MPLRDQVVDERQHCSRVAIGALRDERSVRTCELIVYPVVAELQLTRRRSPGELVSESRESARCAWLPRPQGIRTWCRIPCAPRGALQSGLEQILSIAPHMRWAMLIAARDPRSHAECSRSRAAISCRTSSRPAVVPVPREHD